MSTPTVVAIGGGHGLSATLRALRLLPVDPVAVVSVADDGGSTGRLRAAGERLAPGDLRKCLVALAEDSSPLLTVMEHRFESGELKGHSFGNLLLAAFEESSGSMLGALDEVGGMLGVAGRVLPATMEPVELVAELADGSICVGQELISGTAGVRRVRLDPEPTACDEALEAISHADLVVLGPGSLYTSVLAAVAVPGVGEAIAQGEAPLAYVSNLAPQARETDGYDVADHVDALSRHGLVPDLVFHDDSRIGGAESVAGARTANLVRDGDVAHDAELLASALRSALWGAAGS
ncbi:MAG: uridine diphosphate-N-acetylglucosamine-binding protein YvcK [Actinomycetia bacterium]|nr:uridine diphosphate-N-acetylglucosamine-binding protein YvcK [Actinomycetes bacterium]